MKKVVKIISGFALLTLLSLSFSSFAQPSTVQVNNGNGVVVEINKGEAFLHTTDCEGGELVITSTISSTTHQTKDGFVHISIAVYQLPEGHCRIPEKAVVQRGNFGQGKFVIWHWTPSGKVTVKIIFNSEIL